MFISLTKSGLVFKYHGDKITKYWPWVKRGYYYSELFSEDFNNFRDYWRMVGVESELIRAVHSVGRMSGFGPQEVTGQWSARLYPGEYVVILEDIDLISKGPRFWSRLTSKQKDTLRKGVVVFCCKDRNEAADLVDSIDTNFANAYAFLNGELLYTNTALDGVEEL